MKRVAPRRHDQASLCLACTIARARVHVDWAQARRWRIFTGNLQVKIASGCDVSFESSRSIAGSVPLGPGASGGSISAEGRHRQRRVFD